MASTLYPSQSIANFAVLITGAVWCIAREAGAAHLLACNRRDIVATLLVLCVTPA